MEQRPEVDVAEIMRQVRERAGQERQKFALTNAMAPRRNSQTAEDLGFLQSAHDIQQMHFSSHRKMVGEVIIRAKKVLQQLLTPILERQSAYNAVNARLLASLCERVDRMEDQLAAALEALRAEETAFLEALRETVTGQLELLGQQQASALQALQAEVAAQHRESRARERHMTLLLEEARKRLAESFEQEHVQLVLQEEKRSLDAFFVPFDEQFRGNRQEIKQRLQVYLPLCLEAIRRADGCPLVDLGCGRGEWLELLQESGIQGKGVDSNRVLVEECRQSGLGVVEGDLITYLCSLPDSSLAGVTGFQIIEHLPFDIVLKLFDETVRVLQPGGVAIFETPNPQNILVSTHEFYIDPTHRHPLPAPLIKFVAEVKGLRDVKIMFLHPFPEAQKVPEDGPEVAHRFNELFYGPRDYAVIGRKADR